MTKANGRHVNIPIFIPHMGCPNACVFCNQRTISGKTRFDPSTVRAEIEAALSTVEESANCEIAFFGGSFTGIDRALMKELLAVAQAYRQTGRVKGIRLSTRPDYVDDEVLCILRDYGVEIIELGLQSMDDEVLRASRRGHDGACARAACERIKAYGFSLVGQMMIGLPGSDGVRERFTAEEICRMGADAVRVYPTVVFYETELCHMAMEGTYALLSVEEAVLRTADVLEIFDRHAVPCIRVGLCAGEGLSSPDTVYGGPNHAALGEMAMSEVFYRRMASALEKQKEDVVGRTVTILVPRGSISKAVGQKRKNIARLRQTYGVNAVKVLEKNSLLGYNIVIGFHGFS